MRSCFQKRSCCRVTSPAAGICKATRRLTFPWKQAVEDTVHKAVLNFRGRTVNRGQHRPAHDLYMVSRNTLDNLL